MEGLAMDLILTFRKPLSSHEVLALNHRINQDLGTRASFKMRLAQQIFTEVEVNFEPNGLALKRLKKIGRVRNFRVADKI